MPTYNNTLHNRSLNVRRMTIWLLIIFNILSILSSSHLAVLKAAADIEADEAAETDESSDEKTHIRSIIPYVDIMENGVAQSVPVSSREDTRANPNTTFLMIQLVVDNQDAQKYYGNSLYIFKLKTYQEISDLAEQTPITSFIVQEENFFVYNVKLLMDLSVLNNGEIYNKFVIATKLDSNEYVPISEAKYIDNINFLSNKKDTPPVSISKKGLAVQMMGEASLLGVEHTTVKMFLNEFMSFEETPNTEVYFYEGESFYFNMNKIAEYDKLIKSFTNDGIKVTAILLLGADRELRETSINVVSEAESSVDSSEADGSAAENDSPLPASPAQYLIHPNALELPETDTIPMFYGINTATEEGVKYFSALMSFIADRYIREDGGGGRIYNIILGDEIGNSAKYNNCGQIGFSEYIRDYLRALRICDTAARSRFGGSRVYVPLNNSFASRPAGESGYNNKDVIDALCEYSVTEGNFNWNIAFHAYNNDRANPEIWNETEPLDSYDTPVITLKNINILCDYINIEKKEYLPDGERRKIMLAEQGFSSGESVSTEEKMNMQAAAFVYAYIKVRDLPDITALIYHRHVDAEEDVYLYGLWTKFTDNSNEPRKKKKIYDVFKYMDTNKETEQIEFAKALIGIESFGDISARYSSEREAAVNIHEVAVTTVKSRLSSTQIGRFNTADLKGFIGTSNVAFLNIVKYSGESERFGNNQNSLLIGFNRTSQGNYGGIVKSYVSDEVLDLSDKRYIGMNIRIDTTAKNIETVPLLLILEGEFVDNAAEKKEKDTPTSSNSSVITSGVIQTVETETDETVKSIGIFEGAANITPNEDVVVYFDLKDFKESGKINKIKLLINPYYSQSSESSNIEFINAHETDAAAKDGDGSGDEEISESSEVAKYDFNFYVYSIFSSSPAKMSLLRVLLTIAIILVAIVVLGYAALVIRARVITNRRRKRRMEQRRRRRQQQQRPPRPQQ